MLKIQGLSVEIEQLSHDQHVPTRHRRRLTLVDLSPLNQVIRHIPALTQALHLELESAVITYVAIPDAQLIIDGVTLDMHLAFSHLLVPVPHSDTMIGQGYHRLSAAELAMEAWKSRLVMGFKQTWMHTWDRMLGQTKASLTFYLMINNVVGDIPSHSEHPSFE